MERPGKNRADLAAASRDDHFHTSINLSRSSALGIMHCSYLPKMRYRTRARVSYPKFNSESGRIPKIPAQRHGTPKVSKTNKPAAARSNGTAEFVVRDDIKRVEVGRVSIESSKVGLPDGALKRSEPETGTLIVLQDKRIHPVA
jgi:hypothetical protein